MGELIRTTLSDVDKALQHEKNIGVDTHVEADVRKKSRLAAQHNLHVEVLPTDNGEVVTIISS